MSPQAETKILEFVARAEAAATIDELLEHGVTLAKEYGATLASYHYLPAVSDLTDTARHYRFGFPPDWSATLERHGANVCDAVRRFSAAGGAARWLSEAAQIQGFSTVDEKCLAAYRTLGLADLLGVPIRGPMGQQGYVGVGFARKPDNGAWVCLVAKCAAQIFHDRYVALLPPRDRPVLSAREGEVLVGIAKGLSNPAIAEQMGCSVYTVDTYVRRVFAKLGVSDRINASLVGLDYGLLSFNAAPGKDYAFEQPRSG